MNWAWASGLEQLWRSPDFPVWLALGGALFFGLLALVALLRAEKSVASGALAVIALLAIAVAAAATIRSLEAGGQGGAAPTAMMPPPPRVAASLPALACLDDLAGDVVLAACEKALFGSADAVAAAVSATAAKLGWLTAYGNVAAANKAMTSDLLVLRHALERDRYGLVAYVLQIRDRCDPDECAAYAALTDHRQIAANMDERTFDGLVTRYAAVWNASPPVSGAGGLPVSVPTGKPTTADFPSAASIPPVNIMTPEPVTPARPPAAANAQAPRPAVTAAPATTTAPTPKKPAVPKAARPQAAAPSGPVQLAPIASDPDN